MWIFNKKHTIEKERIEVKIDKNGIVDTFRLSSIYNFDNNLDPIVLTIPKGKDSMLIDDSTILSMLDFIKRHYDDKTFIEASRIIGPFRVIYSIGEIPKVFANMTFKYVDPTNVKEGFQYFAVVILMGENDKAIGRGIFFNVVKEENINKHFQTDIKL